MMSKPLKGGIVADFGFRMGSRKMILFEPDAGLFIGLLSFTTLKLAVLNKLNQLFNF